MATLREIAYDIMQHARQELHDDDNLDIRQVYYWIKNQRSLWIKNELSKNHPLSEKMSQTMSPLALQVDTSSTTVLSTSLVICKRYRIVTLGTSDFTLAGAESNTVGEVFTATGTTPGTGTAINIDTYEKRTIKQLPDIMYYRGFPQVTWVGPTTRADAPFLFLPYKSARYHGHGRFNSILTIAYYLDGYIYIRGEGISNTSITVKAILEDPTKITGFSEDDEYPLDDSLIDYMKAEIIKLDLAAFMRALSDQVTDEQDDTTTNLQSTR